MNYYNYYGLLDGWFSKPEPRYIPKRSMYIKNKQKRKRNKKNKRK